MEKGARLGAKFFCNAAGSMLKRIRKSPLATIFLGAKWENLRHFFLIMIPNVISVVLEGASFVFILLAFSQFAGEEAPLSGQKIPFIDTWVANYHFNTPFTAFITWILVAVILQIFRSSTAFFASYLTSNLSLKIQNEAQFKVYKQILHLSFPCVNRYRLGDLAEYAKTPSTFIPPFVDNFNRFVIACLMVLVALLLMLKISALLTVITMVLFLTFGISQKSIIRKIMQSSKHLSEQMADFGKLTIQSLEGLRLIHTFHRHNKVFRDISELLGGISNTSKRLHFWNNSIPSVNETIGVLLIGFILISSLFVFDTHKVHGIPYLFTFLILAYRASTRVQLMVGYIAALAFYSGPILRLKEILKDDDKEYAATTGRPLESFNEGIEFRSVTLKYDKDLKPSVTNLSFTIPKKTVVAIVGPSGGGKSSILDMIIRLYEPTQGAILIDGQPLSDFDLASWRNVLGVVSQDSYIFNDTVEENIRFGVDHVARDQLIHIAKLTGAHDFIIKLSDGYQTKLGEKGYKLSGGELQRISLARALVKDPKILILDEATSSLDSITEQIVQKALEDYSLDRTVIIVAHRLSTIAFADQILYIENGQLQESGTHQSLIEREGKYAYLWKLQSKVLDRHSVVSTID